MPNRENGTIKLLNRDKGLLMIERDSGASVRVPVSSIDHDTLESLFQDQKVSFVATEEATGTTITQIQSIS